MSDPNTTPPIIVNPSPLPDQAQAIIRQLLTIVGGALISRGVLTADQLQVWIGLILPVGSLAWALYQATHRKKQLVSIAKDPNVPNTSVRLK